MGLNISLHDPCLTSGVITNPSYPACTSDLQSWLHGRLYVDGFVFYLFDPNQEELFKSLVQEKIQVDIMVNVYYLLGTAFIWLQHTDGKISVRLCQLTFTEFSDHQFSVHTENKFPNMTPYCFGFPIDSILPIDPPDPDLPRQKQVYQSIVGWINWLETWTRHDIAPALTFLASYSNAPHPQH